MPTSSTASTTVRSSAIAVALVAILISCLWSAIASVAPLRRTLHLSNLPDDVFRSPYDARVLDAPVASGFPLQVLARILISSPLGDAVTRRLVLRNGISQVVELAEALQSPDVNGRDGSGAEFGLGEPLIRLSGEERRWHADAAVAAADDSERLRSTERTTAARRYNSVRDYRAAYLRSDTTPSIVLSKLFDFIERTNDDLRCVQEVDFDGARQAASESSQRYASGTSLGIWDGIPVFIKAEEDVRGLRTSKGQRFRNDPSLDTAAHDGIVASRFRAAGAIIVGTTVMHERGVQPTGFNPWHGGPMNPYDLSRFSGGSSSGSAVVVATGMAPVAIGWDGGGSIRIPAAWSGTVGLAAGYGRIPYGRPLSGGGSGDIPNVASVSKAGPLAATVSDAADAYLLLGQPLGHDEGRSDHLYHVLHDGENGDGPPPPHLRPRWWNRGRSDKPGVLVGIFPEWNAHRPMGTGAGQTGKDDMVHKTLQRVLAALERSGPSMPFRVDITEIALPHMHVQALAHAFLISSMFSFLLASEAFRDTSSRASVETDDDLQPATEIQIQVGRQVTAVELLACQRVRAFAMAQWRRVLAGRDAGGVDVILSPTTPMTAIVRPKGSDEVGFSDSALFVQMMRYIWPANLAGMPALVVPVGVDEAGLPVSMQMTCLHWHEADCLALGRTIEDLFANERPLPSENLFVDLLV